MFRRREDGAEIVSWMAQSSRKHIAVEQIDVADQPRIEQRGLVGRRLSATDQRARAAGTIFRELFAQRREWSTGQRGDRATEAVEDVALEELADVRLQSLCRCAICKGGDRVDCRNRNIGVQVHAGDPIRALACTPVDSSPVRNCARPAPNDQSSSAFVTQFTMTSSGEIPQRVASLSTKKRWKFSFISRL